MIDQQAIWLGAVLGFLVLGSVRAREHIDVKKLVQEEIPFQNVDGGAWKQGWRVTYDKSQWTSDQPLRVFVMPHSHVDAGWVKTFDQYYTAQTRGIISSVVNSLYAVEQRHFLWADIGFFQRWWDEADSALRSRAKTIIARGQLEFVTGAWVTTDEANPRYPEMLEQVLEGHEWLRTNLGVRPRFGWSIDPFGHSPTMAYLLARVGFDGIIINRVHYEIKKALALNQSLEFYWRQEWDQTPPPDDTQFFTQPFQSSEILTHMFPFYSYDVPHTCGPEPAICCEFDFARGGCPWAGHRPTPINSGNLRAQATKLLDQYRKKSQLFRTRNVLIPVGDDFRYVTTNYQKLFDFINLNKEEFHAEVRFSNLTSYFEAVKSDLKSTRTKLPSLSGDFFTYSDRDQDYWSGYFTSRPFYKRLGRLTQSTVRAAELLHSLLHARMNKGNQDESPTVRGALIEARRTMGIYQHHDAVTGTAKKHVNDDYGKMLHHARHDMRELMRSSLDSLLRGRDGAPARFSSQGALVDRTELSTRDANSLPLEFSLSLDDGTRAVVVFNSLPQARTELLSIPVEYRDVRVLDVRGTPIVSQLLPNWYEQHEQAAAPYRVFFAARLLPLGYSTFFLERDEQGEPQRRAQIAIVESNMDDSGARYAEFKPNRVSSLPKATKLGTIAVVDSRGLLSKLAVASSGTDATLRAVAEDLGVYQTRASGSSGAYLIDPKMGRYTSLINGCSFLTTACARVRLVKGPVFDESYVTTVSGRVERWLRVYHANSGIGASVPFVDVTHRAQLDESMKNNEFVARYDASAALAPGVPHVLYTDANGFQMQARPYNAKLPLAANIYPATSEAFVRSSDAAARFSVLLAQSQAAMAHTAGVLEFIVDRRTSGDDNRGVGQALNDNLPTVAHHRLLLEQFAHADSRLHSSAAAHSLGRQLEHEPQVFYTTAAAPRSAESWQREIGPDRSLLDSATPWPRDVLLETVRVYEEDQNQLLVYARRVPQLDAPAPASLSLDLPLFDRLPLTDSARFTLSMMRSDDSYRHGDAVVERAMEFECYRVTPGAPPSQEQLAANEQRRQANSKQQSTMAVAAGKRVAQRPVVGGNDENVTTHEREVVSEHTPPSVILALLVTGAMLTLQAVIALCTARQSKLKGLVLGSIFIVTCFWLQLLILRTIKS